MSPIASWGETMAAIGQRQIYDTRVQAAQSSATPQLAAATVAHANTYPWMSPQTSYALAANGNQPGDPLSKAVATASVNHKGGGFMGFFGHIVDAGARAAIHLGADLQGMGKVAARTAFTGLNAAWEVPVGVGRDVAGLAENVVGGAGDVVGGALAGAATGFTVGGLGGGTLGSIIPGFGTLAGAIGGATGGALYGAAAGAVTGLAAHTQGRDISSSGVVNPLSQSAGGLAIQKLVTGHAGDIDLGSGFMPGGALSAEATKNMQNAASINGHALTPGRMLASGVWRPGTGGYNMLSGMVDGIDRWKLDPGTHLTKEVGGLVRQAKVIPGAVRAVTESGAAAEAGPVTSLLTKAGILDAADPAFNRQVARDFLTTDPRARRFITKAAETDSASAIQEASNGKIGSQLANQLRAHTTEDGVLDTLLNHMESQGLREKAAVQSGRGITSALPTFRPPARLAAVYDRLTSTMPSHSVDLRDIDQAGGAFKLDKAVEQVKNLLTQYRLPAAERGPILDRLMATTTAEEAKQVITETIHGDLRSRLLAAGMPEEAVQNVFKTSAADRQALMSQVHYEVANDLPQRALAVVQPELAAAERPGTFVAGAPGTAGKWEAAGQGTGEAVFEGPAQAHLPGAEQPGRWVPGTRGTPGHWEAAGTATGKTIFDEPQHLFAGMERPGTPTQQILGEAEAPGRFVPGESGTPARLEPTGAGPAGEVFPGAGQPTLAGAEQPGTFVPGTAGTPGRWEYRGMDPAEQPIFHPLNKASDVMAAEDTHVQLPDGRAIKRMTTPSARLNAIYNSKAFLETEHAADYFMGAWRKLNLQRIALPLRMIGMGQARIGANGLETVLSDPIAQFSMLLGRSTRPGALEGLVEGTPLSQAEEVMKMGRRVSGHLSSDDLAAYQQTLGPGDEGFARSWSARVAEQHADPVARTIAAGGHEAAAASFWDGPLSEERLRLADEMNMPELKTPEGARAYVHDTVGSHLHAITGDDPNLMAAVASGRLAGVDLLKAHPGGLVNPELESALQKMVDDPNLKVPNTMKAAKPHEIDPDYGNKVGRVTSAFYSTLVGKPMAGLINHPIFNQTYWAAVADHASMLDDEGRAVLLERMGADNVRIPKATEANIRATLDASAPGANTFEDVHKLSEAQGVQKLQDMTIDMSKKQGWQDAMRHVMPFAKHWQQETTQWAKLLTTHPEAFQKAQMAVHGAEGAGWFHRNDQGALVFNYPGSGLVSKVLTGVDMPITGKVGGFSTMTTDLFPGFGPGVSIAASKLLPNRPEFDSIRQFMSPYGDPTAKGLLGAVEPSWMHTLQQGLSDPQNDRDTANTTMQVARYLVSTGKYNMDTPEDVDKTLEAAGSRAKHLLQLQALGKFVLPASPTLQPMAQDKDGRTVVAKQLSTDLIQMRKDDYENSTQNFLDKYGDNAFLYLQAATRPVVAGSASTKEQENFARANPELVKAFPNSYAFFAPQGAQTPDFNTITQQLHTGDRQALTPKQQVAMANDQVGSMIYYNAKAKLGTRISAPQQAWLSQLRDALIQKYPGFGVPVVGLATRVTDTPAGIADVVLPEMRKAVADPKMAATDTGRALTQYMQLRDGIDKIAQGRGLKPNAFTQATHAVDLRAVLNQAANVLGQQSPGFSLLFDRLLSRELRTDTQPQPAAASA